MKRWKVLHGLDRLEDQAEIKRYNREFEKVYGNATTLFDSDRKAFVEMVQANFGPDDVLKILFGSVSSGKSKLRRALRAKPAKKGPRHAKPKKR